MKICPICGFQTENAKIYANHIRWAHKMPKDSEKYENYVKKVSQEHILIKKQCICERCGKIFYQEHTETDWKNKKKVRRFCSSSCAHSRKHSKSTKEKIKESLKNIQPVLGKHILTTKICLYCHKEFHPHRSKQIYCSKKCGIKNRIQNRAKKLDKSKYKDYMKLCEFDFNLKDYPNEFDFELIVKYGWYSAANSKHPNLNGVSRDHIVSRKYGFDHNIPPEIIKHPANCQLLRHMDNMKKNSKCDITLEELNIRIKNWNEKYKIII